MKLKWIALGALALIAIAGYLALPYFFPPALGAPGRSVSSNRTRSAIRPTSWCSSTRGGPRTSATGSTPSARVPGWFRTRGGLFSRTLTASNSLAATMPSGPPR